VRIKSTSSKAGINMERVMKAMRPNNEIQKLAILAPISMNKIIPTPLKHCSLSTSVIRWLNDIPVTSFHFSKLGV